MLGPNVRIKRAFEKEMIFVFDYLSQAELALHMRSLNSRRLPMEDPQSMLPKAELGKSPLKEVAWGPRFVTCLPKVGGVCPVPLSVYPLVKVC